MFEFSLFSGLYFFNYLGVGQIAQAWRKDFIKKHQQEFSERTKLAFLMTKTDSALAQVDDFFDAVSRLFSRLQISEKPEHLWNFGVADVLLPEPPKKTSRRPGSKNQSPK